MVGCAGTRRSDQIMYVWFDALSIHYSAWIRCEHGALSPLLGPGGEAKRELAHVIGKGIIRFHAVYWLGMLLSARIPLPTVEFVHGYITVGGEKMSKSLGNVLDPYSVVSSYGTDPFRYFMLGALSSYNDGDFSDGRLQEFYTAHLANGIGNLTCRILTMLEKYSRSAVPAEASDSFDTASFWQAYEKAMGEFRFDDAVKCIQSVVAVCDQTISDEKPWAKAKAGENIDALLYQLAETLRHVAVALLPIIPVSAEKILSQLGISRSSVGTLGDEKQWGKLKEGVIIKKGEQLFPRLA